MNLIRDWRLIYGLLPAKDQRKIFALLGLTTISGIIQALGVISIMPFIAVVANPELVKTNTYLAQAYAYLEVSSMSSFLVMLGLASALILAASNAFMTLTVWLTVRFCNMREYDLQKKLLETYLAQPYSSLLQRNTAELSKNVLGEVERVVVGSLLAYIRLFADAVIAALLIAILLSVDPWITLATSIVLAIAYLIIFFSIQSRLNTLGHAHVTLGTDIFMTVREALEGIKAIKILGREAFFIDRYAKPTHEAARNAVSYSVLEFIPGPLLETVTFTVIIFVTVYFAASVEHAGTIFPTLAMFAFAAYRLVPALKSIFDGMELLTFNSRALNELRSDLTFEPDRSKTDQHRGLLRDRLVFRNVSFRYAGDSTAGVSNLDIEIPAHSSVCLMGQTGGGKSTTVDLLLGLLVPDSGEILADGVSIHGDNGRSWRRIVGYVPQVIYLIDDTIMRNIAFGLEDDEIDRDKVIAAAKLANLDQFVGSLPDGYATPVGERGAKLSGGQRQRIGIARALYDDPQILILDEATNEVDNKTEMDIADSLFGLTDKTIIFSTHSAAIANRCEKVFLIDQGRIVGSGEYQALLEERPAFRELTAHGRRGD